MNTVLPIALDFTQHEDLIIPQIETPFNIIAQLGEGETQLPQATDMYVGTELQDGKLVITYIGSGYNKEDADLILDYYPRLYSVFSPHIDGPILSERHLFIHLEKEGLRLSPDANVVNVKQYKKKKVAAEDFNFRTAYSEWEQICSQRKTAIREAKLSVKQALAERDVWVAQKNAEISQLRAILNDLEAEPIPQRPVRDNTL